MIVTTMNTEETYREVMRDYQCLQQKVLQSSLSFQLEMARKKILTTAKTFTYQSPHHNKWQICMRRLHGRLGITVYLKSVDEKGVVAYIVEKYKDSNATFVTKFNSHFFKRYNERLHLGLNEPSKVIKHFFRYNDYSRIGFTDVLEHGTRNIISVFESGIAIGWQQDSTRTTQFKTFIAHDTLTEKQKKLTTFILTQDNSEEFCINVKKIKLKYKFR